MELETKANHIEKKSIFLREISDFGVIKKDKLTKHPNLKLIRERKINILQRLVQTIYFDKNFHPIKNLNSETIKNSSREVFFSFEIHSDLRDFGTDKNSDSFVNDNSLNSASSRRRRRRKFASDEERRIARILKNRRTAEESRQRRIQKMKDLEIFAANFEEREKKLRDEIRYLGKQNASQAVELMLLMEKFNKSTKAQTGSLKV